MVVCIYIFWLGNGMNLLLIHLLLVVMMARLLLLSTLDVDFCWKKIEDPSFALFFPSGSAAFSIFIK